MNKIYNELAMIDEFEANFNPTNESKKRKEELLKQLNIHICTIK